MPVLPHRRSVGLVAAALAVALTACGGGGEQGQPAPAPSSDADVVLTGDDSLKYDTTEVSADAGEITFQLVNVGAVPHDIVIEEAGDTVVVEAGGGQTAQGTIQLDAGTYTFYCAIPGHRNAGMEGTLTVE